MKKRGVKRNISVGWQWGRRSGEPYYRRALERLSKSLAKPLEALTPWRNLKILVIFVGVCLILCFVAGAFNGMVGLDPVSIWELLALVTTLYFSFAYLVDLWKETNDKNRFVINRLTMFTILPGCIANIVLLLGAAVLLVWDSQKRLEEAGHNEISWHYIGYVGCVALSFGAFAALDGIFARHSRCFSKVREYWTVMLFVDAPAALAFVILFLYLLVVRISGRDAPKDIFGGAAAMQMLLADIVFLAVNWNFHFHVLPFLCQETDKE